MITQIESFIGYFEGVRRRSLNYCRAIPPEQIDWAPRPDEMSFGGLIIHLAGAEQMFTGVAVNDRWVFPRHDAQAGIGHAEALAFLAAAHAEALAALRTLSAADLTARRATLDGRPLEVWRVLMLMVEHEIHHRSQIASHLAQLGVAPPQIYGMSLEELMIRTGGA